MPDGHGAFSKKQLMVLSGAVRRLNFYRGLDRRAELFNVPFIGGAMTRSNPKERLTLSDDDVRPCLRIPLRNNTETGMTVMHVRTCREIQQEDHPTNGISCNSGGYRSTMCHPLSHVIHSLRSAPALPLPAPPNPAPPNPASCLPLSSP